MQVSRYIVDLQGYGRVFKTFIINLGVSEQLMPNVIGHVRYTDFVYTESAMQLMMIYGPNYSEFLKALAIYPDMTLFANIPELTNPLKREVFIQKFREFGFHFSEIIRSKIGINFSAEVS